MSDVNKNPDLALEAYTRSSHTQSFVVPAGAFFGVNSYGQTFYLTECTGPIDISTDVTSPKTYKKGQGERFPIELRFKRLEFKNNTASPITLTIWSGFGEFIDSRFEVLESFTKTYGSAVTNVPDGDQIDFDGIPSVAGQLQRKAIVVSNIDPNGVLILVDEDGNFCCAVFPETSITLPISGFVAVRNESGADITAYISEIWYANQT